MANYAKRREGILRYLEERGLDEMTAIWQKYVK